MKHVFISYSRKDTEFVERFERDLNARGVETWRDQVNIEGGAAWFRSIKVGLDAGYAMLYVDTANADLSEWTEIEFLYAKAIKLKIVPLKLDPTFLSIRTVNLQPILCDVDKYDAAINKLCVVLDTISASDTTVKPPFSASSTSGRTQEELTYLKWVLLKAGAKLLDQRYIGLSATSELEIDFWFRDDKFNFDRLDLERIYQDEFDNPGESVSDARMAIRESRRTLLLGDPGSGKTTTLLQLAVDLARAAESDPKERLPVFVPLREFNGAMPFEAFVRAQMNNLQSAYDRLLKADRLMILCDALNEMPRRAADGRDLVAEVRKYLGITSSWVVSCRVRDYQEELKDLPELGKVRLKLFDLPRIRYFFQRRFHADPAKGEALWKELRGSDALLTLWEKFASSGNTEQFWQPEKWFYVFESEYLPLEYLYNDLRRMMLLCRVPYMTSMICKLYEISGRLSENRGELFASFVDELLKREKRNSEQIGAAWIEDRQIRAGLAHIGFALGAKAALLYTYAEAIIHQHVPDVDAALLLRLAASANLIEIGDSVRFTHQLLQEYFASEVLGALMDTEPDGAVKLWPADRWWEPNDREETAIILAGVRGDPVGVAIWVSVAQPDFAWQILTESGIAIDTTQLAEKTRDALLHSARQWIAKSSSRDRAAGYRLLGYLDADKRLGVGNKNTLPDIAWCPPISAGSFLYGDEFHGGEKVISQINYNFTVAKYPITNAQFRAFMSAEDGYSQWEWWIDPAFEQESKRHYLSEYPYSNAYLSSNNPRIYVTWFEAMAFCNWLTARMYPDVWETAKNLWMKTPLNEIKGLIRLPTEQEWERAARGIDGRMYPWGDTFNAEWSNSNLGEFPINMPSAVGIFPKDVSPSKAFDMAGNVLEWCLTEYGNPQSININNIAERVARGGAFSLGEENACVAHRKNERQLARYNDLGFRCARSL